MAHRAIAIAAAFVAVWAVPAWAPGSAKPTGAGFELRSSHVGPATVYFDGERPATLRFRFAANRRLDLVIRVVRVSDHNPVRRWVAHGLAPGKLHRLRWDGRRGDRGVPSDGTYEFRIGPAGHDGSSAGRFEFHDQVFPVAGAHTYGDPFGDPRSGGRVHEGQDLPAACGTRLIAARGGTVAATGYSDALYGYYVLIDGLATEHDYFYAHLEAPTPLSEGDRVRTGEEIGRVGKTGNARNEFCQLHFELWPHGYHDGAPEDPAPALHEWDAFS
jgi:murein DD-endopeptidase MepM/ murein hydrolase activator NlpD